MTDHLVDLIEAARWIDRLYGTDHPQGLKELREEVGKLRVALRGIREDMSKSDDSNDRF